MNLHSESSDTYHDKNLVRVARSLPIAGALVSIAAITPSVGVSASALFYSAAVGMWFGDGIELHHFRSDLKDIGEPSRRIYRLHTASSIFFLAPLASFAFHLPFTSKYIELYNINPTFSIQDVFLLLVSCFLFFILLLNRRRRLGLIAGAAS